MPTETVTLPSGGRVYDTGSSIYGRESVEIKSLTAKEEDILSSADYIQNGIVFDKLFESILIDKTIDPKDFVIGDRNAILLASRISGYGKEYEVTKTCENCNKRTTHEYDLTVNKTKEVDLESLEVEYDNGLFWFTLPQTNLRTGIRPLTAGDRDLVEKQQAKKAELGIESSTLIDFLRTIVVEVGGSTNRAEINKFIELMPAADCRRIRSVYKKVIPDVDTTQTIVCSACSWEHESEVWFGLNFFWPEL